MDTSKYKALYLQEAAEHISGIEKGLLLLEKGLRETSEIDNLFRHYHSIKGMSASMGYDPVMKLAHVQEDLLDRVRSGRLELSADAVSALFQCLDGLKELLRRVSEGLPLDIDPAPFIEKIKTAMEGGPGKQSPAVKEAAPAPSQPDSPLRLSHLMKVEGRVFDDLLATVGDLFMALSTFKAMTHNSRSVALKDGVYVFGKSINRLHNDILSARMLPIKDLTEGLPRIVRDISRKSGKEIDFRMEGAEISLDRSILEGLGSPLVHIVRNAVDHGIESAAERIRAGKPGNGSISVKAYGKKDRVIIEVLDDGRGIDRERLKEKALQKGFNKDRLNALTGKEVLMLICVPGISTAEVVTDISGRGVGMDIVKDAVEGLGGTLDIASMPGRGTKITMELPRTTSIVKTLLVNVGHEQFLIPISKIERVSEVRSKEVSAGSFTIDGSDIPVLPLDKALGLDVTGERERYTIVTVRGRGPGAGAEGAGDLIGLRVDDFGDEVDAYIKPLLPPISKLWGVSGLTIMGDGRPVFLLDLPQIISKALRA